MGRKLQRIHSVLMAAGLMLALAACNDSSPQMYDYSPVAPSYAQMTQDELRTHMGATIVDKGVNFVVYSEHATRIEILLFDNPESDHPTMRLPLTRHEKSNLWSIYVSGIGNGQHYGYIAWGPNWPYDPDFTPGSAVGFKSDCDKDGNRFNPNKLLIDPYTRRIHRDFDWGKGNPASGTARDISTWGAAAKSVVIQSEYEWSANEKTWLQDRENNAKGHDVNDAIYYEVHPKGFTAKALDVTAPGTWRGIGEKAPYLKDLGITAVELMPVGEKPDDGTYWGYNTIAFFAPEQRFAMPGSKMNSVTDEFKWMVDQLHQHDIEVILDVVYNHTGEGGFWRSKIAQNDFNYGSQADFDDPTAATIYSWRGLDNKAYYHLETMNNKENSGYLDQTGVGNQMRTNHAPFRQLIVDNLRYWVEEMHVDGFRFDLAPILGVNDNNQDKVGNPNEFWKNNVKNTVVQDIINDPVLQKHNTRLIAEPWDLQHYAIGLFPKATTGNTELAWSEWNGRFRDMVRKFVNYDDFTLGSTDGIPPYWEQKLNIGNMLIGSSELFGDDGRKPYNSVNFITAHDGFTMYDLVTYSKKRNGCGKLNPICCDQPYNAFCDTVSGANDDNFSRAWCATGKDTSSGNNDYVTNQGVCDDQNNEVLKRQMIRNFFALMMVSHGSPMILGGDEYMRTQFGNNNAYSDSADNEYNWFRWGDWTQSPEHVRMHDFVRSLIRIRKQYGEHLAPRVYKTDNFHWHGPDGNPENFWGGKSLAMYYPATGTADALFVIINMETYDEKAFTLPEGEWKILADTQSYFDTPEFIAENKLDEMKSHNALSENLKAVSGTYTAKPRSIVILALPKAVSK